MTFPILALAVVGSWIAYGAFALYRSRMEARARNR